eukprot:TRINITY_DN63426_c0_g1_i1.p1 TRINITY_DN63426_c0_g1~~TRINITY_DN63426_c0_g1_i1.p1  ORF type:complete len:509 (-),score=51.75 TRINITY_DN63426_c0_g1_i1:84-1610(-)
MFRTFRRLQCAMPLASMPGPNIQNLMEFYQKFPNQGTRARDWGLALNKAYGDVVHIPSPQTGGDQVIAFHPVDIENIMRKEGKYPIGAASLLFMFNYYNQKHGNTGNVGNSQGEEWRRLRSALQKNFFGPKDAASYLPLITPAASDAIGCIGSFSSDLNQFMSLTTYDMMNAVMFGEGLHLASGHGKCDAKDFEFVEHARNTFKAMTRLFSDPKQTGLFFEKPESSEAYIEFESNFSACLARGEYHLENFMAALEKSSSSSPLRDTYIAKKIADKDLTKEEFVSNILGFLFAGVDTTANTLQWIVYQLAAHPQAQAKLRSTVTELLQGGDLTAEAWNKLSYLRFVFKETNRVTPAVDGTIRVLPADYTLRGYNVPAGTMIMLNPSPYHKSTDIWGDDASQWNPERWDRAAQKEAKTEASQNQKHSEYQLDPSFQSSPFLVMPFSKGPRMCLGARLSECEMAAICTRLVQDYEFRLADDSPTPEIDTTGGLARPVPQPKYVFTPMKNKN